MFQENVLLKNYSNYKIGGPARYFFEAKNLKEIIYAIKQARKIETPVFILGGGANILFSDKGFNGLVLKPSIKFISIKEKKELIFFKVGAGVLLSDAVKESAKNGFTGLEWAAGIPGTIGGAVKGNAGAFGGEIKDLIKELVSVDFSGSRLKIIKRNNRECEFDYRSSIFKNRPEIIIEATLVLRKGKKNLIKAMIEENINYRKERQPLEYPSLGSTFKNVDVEKISQKRRKEFQSIIKTDPFPMIPAAYLISKANLKGVSRGGAMISEKHPNFIVNVRDATANDVKKLISLIKKEVFKKFKIKLEEEIVILK